VKVRRRRLAPLHIGPVSNLDELNKVRRQLQAADVSARRRPGHPLHAFLDEWLPGSSS